MLKLLLFAGETYYVVIIFSFVADRCLDLDNVLLFHLLTQTQVLDLLALLPATTWILCVIRSPCHIISRDPQPVPVWWPLTFCTQLQTQGLNHSTSPAQLASFTNCFTLQQLQTSKWHKENKTKMKATVLHSQTTALVTMIMFTSSCTAVLVGMKIKVFASCVKIFISSTDLGLTAEQKPISATEWPSGWCHLSQKVTRSCKSLGPSGKDGGLWALCSVSCEASIETCVWPHHLRFIYSATGGLSRGVDTSPEDLCTCSISVFVSW